MPHFYISRLPDKFPTRHPQQNGKRANRGGGMVQVRDTPCALHLLRRIPLRSPQPAQHAFIGLYIFDFQSFANSLLQSFARNKLRQLAVLELCREGNVFQDIECSCYFDAYFRSKLRMVKKVWLLAYYSSTTTTLEILVLKPLATFFFDRFSQPCQLRNSSCAA